LPPIELWLWILGEWWTLERTLSCWVVAMSIDELPLRKCWALKLFRSNS
jgi:hypothetical protein